MEHIGDAAECGAGATEPSQQKQQSKNANATKNSRVKVFFVAPLFPTSGIKTRLRSSGSKQGGDRSGLIAINGLRL
ncbi:hypothetical protein MRB53_016259 [Persea americana]|uniref:Uncharacterized protein n=1 Tax=Persea americana TaxID=3435 RepID=A0ACC2M1M7_PERAE|nr:hypothetical protein MRB53_016259 [Persea americana]